MSNELEGREFAELLAAKLAQGRLLSDRFTNTELIVANLIYQHYHGLRGPLHHLPEFRDDDSPFGLREPVSIIDAIATSELSPAVYPDDAPVFQGFGGGESGGAGASGSFDAPTPEPSVPDPGPACDTTDTSSTDTSVDTSSCDTGSTSDS